MLNANKNRDDVASRLLVRAGIDRGGVVGVVVNNCPLALAEAPERENARILRDYSHRIGRLAGGSTTPDLDCRRGGLVG